MKKLLLILLAGLLTTTSSFAQQRKLRQENMELQAANQQLQGRLDSLSRELDRCRLKLDSLDLLLSTPEEVVADENFSVSDSLLRVWYMQSGSVHSMAYDIETEHFESNVPDSVFMARLDAMNSIIPLAFNSVVKNYCIVYSEKMKSSMGQMLGEAEYYWPMFDEVLSAYGLPLELKALVIVESKLKPTARSRMGAVGLWQFMYSTAKGYGMHIDSWTDERRDPVKSTIGAARYLRDAHNVFGDWLLAIASYNCGAGNVSKAIRRSGKNDFWGIYDFLPRETRCYVPAFIGALYATHYYKEYGIHPVKSLIAVPVDTFMIHRNLHFEQLQAVLGLPESTIASLNPQYTNKMVPGSSRESVLRLPMEYTNAFIDAGDSLYLYKADTLLNPVLLKKIEEGSIGSGNRIVYKVKAGDNLGYIAKKYRVSVDKLKKWNGLKSSTIRIGQKIYIYK